MREVLKFDYIAMAGMIFGDVPSLDAILETVAKVERHMNIDDKIVEAPPL